LFFCIFASIFVAVDALFLASGNEAADRRARFAVVSRDAPSADAAVLDTDMAESSTAITMHDSGTTNDAGATDRSKLMSSAHLSSVRWSSCESSNGGVPEPRPRLTGAGAGPPSVMTRRGRYLAVHRYAPQNTSTGSSTSGVDVSMSSSRSELVWSGGRRRSAATVAASCVGVTVVSSVDADCEDNCDDLADDSLSLYRSSSFRRAIERGGNVSPPTPTAADDAVDHCLTAPRLTASFHRQAPDSSLSYRLPAESSRVDTREMANPCVSPDDMSVATRTVWNVTVETNSPHVEDSDPFCCYGLSPELGYVFYGIVYNSCMFLSFLFLLLLLTSIATHRTRDQKVVTSAIGCVLQHVNLGQIVYTLMFLLPQICEYFCL